ncbi:FtsH protease activity modulator HflK [Mesobaculum littorinae]|uniref:Protein HflK n=1 Tax=Mesobaculum littorinae TaxID=2486419 RepID=A0A438AIM0_9RHOB|nr:FtsH protease activity modulator HflK [Mesobaculum littorinae]RVV98603.1 FtsH protease activity modulator HflK [Mesobaculum littorinae]
MASNNGGPWGGGPRGGSDGDESRPGPGPRRPANNGGDRPQVPDIDDIVRKGQEHLRVLMGGRGNRPPSNGGGSGGPGVSRGTVGIAVLVLVALWAFSSFYTVRPEERSVELFLGDFSEVGQPGLNFAPWPVVTAEVIPVTTERTEDIGVARGAGDVDAGFMLTTDENIVDIDFQVVWNVTDPAEFLFNLRDPEQTVRAVSESVMREVIAQSELAPILNRDRATIAQTVQERIQSTLDSYQAGINIVRVNLDKADPPGDVIASFREVQEAEQERDRLQRQADAYANRVLAGARGEAAQVLEEAEAYRAQVVNEAEGDASRFTAVLTEYQNAPEVTRKRLYLETMEEVYGRIDKIILDDSAGGAGGQGVVPYLPLNELRRSSGQSATQTGDQN